MTAKGIYLTSLAPGNQLTTNTWDSENRLIHVAMPSGLMNTFSFNGDGQRVGEQDSAGTRILAWDSDNILVEADAGGAVQAVFTYDLAGYGRLVSSNRNGIASFMHFNASGSTVQLSSGSGSITDGYLYDSFGDILFSTGSTVNRYRFIGRLGYVLDTDLGQYSLRARVYDPGAARFRSRDPLGLRSGDYLLYRYAHNNPVNFTDPSGLQDEVDVDVERVNPTCVDDGCGGAKFLTRFSISDPDFSGTIIQKIERKFLAFDCQAKGLVAGFQKPRDYWEAWDVEEGEITPVNAAGVNDNFITCNMNTFASAALGTPTRTCGMVQINGQAIAVPKKLNFGKGSLWHEGQSLPPNFNPCDPKNVNERPWGTLMHTNFRKPPEWLRIGPRQGTYHQLRVIWNCCDANDCPLPQGCIRRKGRERNNRKLRHSEGERSATEIGV